METVKVLHWLKQVGDRVAMGEPLVELETDKATMEVESPQKERSKRSWAPRARNSRSARSLPGSEPPAIPRPQARRNRDGGERRLFTQCGPCRCGVSIVARASAFADPRFSFRQTPRQDEWDRFVGSRGEKPTDANSRARRYRRARDPGCEGETHDASVRGVRAILRCAASDCRVGRPQPKDHSVLRHRPLGRDHRDRPGAHGSRPRDRNSSRAQADVHRFSIDGAGRIFRLASPHPRSLARSERRCGQDWRLELRCRPRRRRR